MTNPLLSLQLDPDFRARIERIAERRDKRLKADFDYLLAFASRALLYATHDNTLTIKEIPDAPR